MMLSARTENYKAPQLKAMDDKLKNIINEKKTRLMNRVSCYFKNYFYSGENKTKWNN